MVRNFRHHFGLGLAEHPKFIPQPIESLPLIPPPSREEIIQRYTKHSQNGGYSLLFIPEIHHSLDHFEKSYVEILKTLAPESLIDVRPAFTGYSAEEIFADSAHFRELGHRLLGKFLAEVMVRKGLLIENAS